jgi:hypothetical protein
VKTSGAVLEHVGPAIQAAQAVKPMPKKTGIVDPFQ